jgi:hypothetical protein
MTPGHFFRSALAMLSATAGLIHFAAAPSHFGQGALHGLFFVALGVFQVATAVLLVRSSASWPLWASAGGSFAILAVWVMSRTTGVPIGPEPWTPEPVGFADSAASILEILVAGGALVLLSPRGRRWVEGTRLHHAGRALVAGASALLVLAAFSVGALGSESHGHGKGTHADAAHGAGTGAGHHKAGTMADHAHAGTEPHTTDHAHAAGAPHQAAGHAQGGAMAADHHTHATPGDEGGHDSHHAEHHMAEHHLAEAPAPAAAAQAIGPAADDRRTTVRYGPFLLPPRSLGGLLHTSLVQPTLVRPCSDCFITSITPDLVYGDGKPANLDTGPMLHHAVWTRPLVPDATCGSGEVLGLVGERFFAAGNERTPLAMPTGFGYHVGNDPWTLITEIMNHSEQLRTVWIELDVTYRPAPDPGIRVVKPVWMDVANCRTSEYHVDAGPSETTWTWTSSLTGRIVAAAGHLHDGGTRISLVNETTGRHVCTSAAAYGTKPAYAGSLESMTACTWDALGTVRSGEVLGIRSFYESAEPADDVMGIMLVMVHPTDDLDGGMPAPETATAATPSGSPPPPAHHH